MYYQRATITRPLEDVAGMVGRVVWLDVETSDRPLLPDAWFPPHVVARSLPLLCVRLEDETTEDPGPPPPWWPNYIAARERLAAQDEEDRA